MANLSAKTGFTPVQTRVTLANNATTSVQEFAAYDGQELTGFVFIDATTDYRATVKIQVVKNGAGTYEVAAADIAGDDNGGSPIVSFSMSGSVLRATLVSYAGFVSAYIQYNLNAPALGANFPLTVDGSNVTLATPTVQGAYKAGQAPGLVTGAAIGSGFIGEVFDVSGTSATVNSAVNLTSKLIPKGIWLIQGLGSCDYLSGAIAASDKGRFIFTTNATPSTTGTINDNMFYTLVGSGGSASVGFPILLNLSVDTTYYLHGIYQSGATTATVYGRLRGVRIG